jgi:hypothetical protein
MYAGGGGGRPNVYVVDSESGAAQLLGDSGLGFAAIGALDFSPSGQLYASVNVVGDGGTGAEHLALIDKTSGRATIIGPFGVEGMEGIAFDAAGTLWGSARARGSTRSGLYRIDTATGAASFLTPLVDSSGTPPSAGVVSIQFLGGELYGGTARAVAPATDGGRLIRIDPATGVFAFVGSTSATGGSSLAALAASGTGSARPDADGDSVQDELDNCPDTPNPTQQDADLNGIGDACELPDLRHSTAGFLQARLDGTTAAEPTSLLISDEPPVLERLVRIVEFRVEAGLADSAQQLTSNLVDSLVEAGVVPPAEANALQTEVLDELNHPPVCTALKASPDVLWPADHKLVKVTVSGATDPDVGDVVTVVVDGVTQDEPTKGLGNGDASPDAQLTSPPSNGVSIRAERGGSGDGRVYRLHVTATDSRGASCEGIVRVSVPRDQRPGSAAVDSAPPIFNSLTG